MIELNSQTLQRQLAQIRIAETKALLWHGPESGELDYRGDRLCFLMAASAFVGVQGFARSASRRAASRQ